MKKSEMDRLRSAAHPNAEYWRAPAGGPRSEFYSYDDAGNRTDSHRMSVYFMNSLTQVAEDD